MAVMTLRLVLPACVAALLLSGCDWFVSPEQRIQRAETYLAQGEDRAAAIELKNALDKQAGNAHARLLLARVSLRLGDTRSADEELQRAVAAGAPAADTAILSADVQLAKGANDALLAQLADGKLALSPAQSATYRGRALLAKNNEVEAMAAFKQALAIEEGSREARLGLAESLARQGDGDAALAEVDNLLKADANNARALMLKGQVLSQRGDARAACDVFGLARKNEKGQLTLAESDDLLAMLVETETAAGDLAGAHRDLAELSRQAPDAPLVHLLSAHIAMAEQNYPLAVTEAQKVVALAPKHPMARLLLGSALMAKGDYNQAEAQLSELVQLAPENLEARKLLAETNLRLQRPDVALQILSAPQSAESVDPQVSALLGWANLQRGDGAAAIDLLKRGVAAQPGNANLKLDLALVYIGVGRSDDAMALLESVPAGAGDARREMLMILAASKGKSPKSAEADVARIAKANGKNVGVLNMAAVFYAEQRNFARARELLTAAVALDPKNTGTLASRARMEIAAGDLDAAQAALRAVLALDPAYPAARVTLARLALQKNDTQTALTELETARRTDPKAIEARLVLAAYYLRQRQTGEANNVLRELDALSEGNPALGVAVGRVYAAAGRFDEALARFQAAERSDPRNPAWSLEVARAQLARGDVRAARVSTQKALDLDANSITANAMMIGLDLKENHGGDARARIVKVKQAHPDDAHVALLDAEMNFSLQDAPAAERAFVASYRLAPSRAAAIGVYRARSMAHLADPTALIADWLTHDPHDLMARTVLAQGLLEQKQYKQAIEQYERMVAEGAANAGVYNNLAWLYSQQHDSRALDTARKAHELAPTSAEVADTYGWILVENDRATEGLPLLESAAADPRASTDIRYHLAVARARCGQHDEARAALRKLLAEPGFEAAAQARKLLAELGG